MVKIFNIVKQKILQQIIFALTFALCFLPKISFAGAFMHIAKKRLWYSKDCSLDKWDNVGCLTCPLFRALYNAASELALAAYNALHTPLEMVIAVATGVWIALKLIKYVASFEAIEPWKMIQEIGYQLFRCMVVVFILHAHYMSVRALTLDPVFQTGMNIAQFFSGERDENGNLTGSKCDNSKTGKVNNKGGLSQDIGNSMLCSVHGVEKMAFDVIGMGETSRCLAYDKQIGYEVDLLVIDFVIPSANYLITGYLLMLIGAVYLIGCPFLLLDGVINMCFAVTLLPAGVACFAFKITSGYLKKIWNTFMDGICTFVFLTLILYVLSSGIISIMLDINANAEAVAPGAKTMGNIIHGLSFVGINFLKLAFIFFLGWSVLEKSVELSSTFAPSGLNPAKGIGSDLGKQAATAVKRFGGSSLGATGVALKAGAKAIGLDAKAQEWRAKAAEAIKSNARTVAGVAPRLFNSYKNSATRKAVRGAAASGMKKFGSYMATTNLGMAAYALHNSEAAQTARLAVKVGATAVSQLANRANRWTINKSRNVAAATLRMHRRNAERVNRGLNSLQEFGDGISDKFSILNKRVSRRINRLQTRINLANRAVSHKVNKIAADVAIGFIASRTGQKFFEMHDSAVATRARRIMRVNALRAAKLAGKAHEFMKNMTADQALDLLGQGIGYVGSIATAVGAGAALANPGVQLAAAGILATYGTGKALAPRARQAYVGIEFVRSATRVGVHNLDGRIANALQNIGVPEEFRTKFNRDGKLLSEQIYDDMMAHNQFDEKNQKIADEYRDQQRARDVRTRSGQEILAERRQQNWQNAQDLHARFEQRKAEVAEQKRQEHWQNAQNIQERIDRKKAEATARQKAQDDAVAAALEKKQHWINSQNMHAQYEQRKSAMEARGKVYSDIDSIMNDPNLTDEEKQEYFNLALEDEKRINNDSKKAQSERDLEGLMATGLTKDEENAALDMAIEAERAEVAQLTATLTPEEEAKIRAQAGEKFDQDLAQMKEAEAAAEAAEREAEERRLALEQAELAAAQAEAEAKAAEEARVAAEWKAYEEAMAEWRKQHDQRSFMEKALGIELSDEEIKKRERKAERLAKWEAMWAEHERQVEEERRLAAENLAAGRSATGDDA